MKLLAKITPRRILAWGPCAEWDAARIRGVFRKHGCTSATPLEVASWEDVPPEDRAWVLLRPGVFTERELRLIACWCAEQALKRERAAGREPAAASWNAVRVARRHADGKATNEELAAARTAAWAAAWDAAGAAARDAARAAAWAAARAAAWAAAWDAARDAAWAAAWDAAWDAAGAAARDAAWSRIFRHVRHVLRKRGHADRS